MVELLNEERSKNEFDIIVSEFKASAHVNAVLSSGISLSGVILLSCGVIEGGGATVAATVDEAEDGLGVDESISFNNIVKISTSSSFQAGRLLLDIAWRVGVVGMERSAPTTCSKSEVSGSDLPRYRAILKLL